MTIPPRARFAMPALCIVAAFAVASVSAQGRGPGGRGMGPGPVPFPMLQRLDLSDAQKEQVRTIMTDTGTRDARQALDKLQRELAAEVLADTPDASRIEQLKTSIHEAEAAALNARVDLQLRIAQVLTPEQRQKARERPAGPRGRGI